MYQYTQFPTFEEYKHMNYLEYREFMRNYKIKVEDERHKFLEDKYWL